MLIPFPTVSLWLASPDLSISSMWLWPWTKHPDQFLCQPWQTMFSCCSSLGLQRHSALQAAPMESGSPGETSEPAGNGGPSEEKVSQNGRACCSALDLVGLLACALASSWSPEEGLLFPGGSWDGIHQGAFFSGLDAWNINYTSYYTLTSQNN